MINVLVGSTVLPGNLEAVLDIYRELVAQTRLEPGCVSYELLQLREDPCNLMLLECWQTQGHLDAHTHTPHFLEAMALLEKLETAAPALIYIKAA
ncbi:putative quinol monooxygenase [Paeniglutamicibacter sp. R2-26]|uniref:putative quinol monooxygenase n=1 Tax=Paeniglutamicibacter sp. R2-26 TaxID=3144417 RepID=UPI003EE81010